MTFKDKLMIYIYKKGTQLDEEYETLNQQCRLMPLDSLEHFELMHAKTRLNAWKEFLRDLYNIVLNCK